MTQLIGYWIKYAKSKNYYWAENFERNAEIFRLQILSKKSNTKIRTYSNNYFGTSLTPILSKSK